LPIQNAEASKTGRIGRKLREWLLEDLQARRRYEPDEFKRSSIPSALRAR
jgi:hypothetical protein